MEEIRILIIEDHPIVLEALTSLIDDAIGLTLMGTANDGQEAVERIRRLNPDLIILDLSVSNLDGVLLIKLFLEIKPDLKVLVFSGHKDENFVYQALKAGARGFVVKEALPEELIQAIQYICEGGIWVSPCFSRHVVEKYLQMLKADDPEKSTFDLLTGREKEVFFLIVAGKETKEIAKTLSISGTTVAKHRIALLQKLSLKNPVELTKYAIRNGLVEDEVEIQRSSTPVP